MATSPPHGSRGGGGRLGARARKARPAACLHAVGARTATTVTTEARRPLTPWDDEASGPRLRR